MKLHLPLPPAAPVPTAVADSSHCSDYLLVCEAQCTSLTDGTWRFTLENADGSPVFDACDQESGDLNRLTLLAAVRGLESIEGPSSVTLLSNNRYLIRSLSDSLPRWRQNHFSWEHFGRRIEVQNSDLWRRVDRAISIHRVEACLISTCLVSKPAAVAPRLIEPATTNADTPRFDAMPGSDDEILRVDGGHSEPSRPHDRLRRWLLSTQADASPLARSRFSSADLREPATA